MSGLEQLLSKMNEAWKKEHDEVYGHLFSKYEVATLEELKSKLFDDFVVHRNQTFNTFEGKLKEGVFLEQSDLVLICDSRSNYGVSGHIKDDGRFEISIYID